MSGTEPFEAVIADMDGVLTRTADVHERAWKRMFDRYLEDRGDPRPFTGDDYRAHVDGKPRADGVRDFLGARGIELPDGEPSDEAGQETVWGLGNRKNAIFVDLLERDGVGVFDDTRAALARWRRAGLAIAVVSSSRNCRRVLAAAGLDEDFDAVVDGVTAAEEGLDGKPDILAAAARRLDVAPARAVVLEDAVAGVAAARRGGFGLVVGVARGGADGGDLDDAGADLVVDDVFRVALRRRMPDVLEHTDALDAWQGGRPLALFLDFDGTLAPIVARPDDAALSDPMREVLERLTARVPVAIVSGRDRRDVEARVAIPGLVYAGNHGFDIAGGGHDKTLPAAEAAVGDVERAERRLAALRERVPGVILERKRFSLAVHYRQVDGDDAVAEVRRAVDDAAAATGLRQRTGKKVLELEPDVAWDKGRALEWLTDALPEMALDRAFAVYVGDDDTDEDAFAALRGRGVGIRVGPEVSDSLADYRVADPAAVEEFLRRQVGRSEAGAGRVDRQHRG